MSSRFLPGSSALAALAVLALVGCGDDSSGGGAPAVAATSSSTAAGSTPGTSAPVSSATPTPAGPRGEMRALWVTRWYAKTEAEVQAALDLMQAHGLNTLLIQAYGDAQALYPSTVAPRSHLVAPGFDVLEATLRLARGTGIEVHAWLNVVNVWSGGLGRPADPNHIVNAHPDWAMVDGAGRSTIQNVGVSGASVFFCPEQAGFVDYLRRLVRELGARYPALTGVHLDYIRYPGADMCYCAAHKQAFRLATGRDPSAGDAAFAAWRYDDITTLVSALHDDLASVSPSTLLTAAVFRQSGMVYQDVTEWLRRGKVDAVFPMIYTADTAAFEALSREWRLNSGGRLIVPGIDCSRGQTGAQIDAARRAGAHGFALFASSIFDAASRAETLVATGGTAVAPPTRPWRDGTPDVEAPLLHGLTQGQVTATAAVFEWLSDEATAGLLVGQDPSGALSHATSVSARGFEHRATLTGLTPNTAYAYEVRVQDGAGNLASHTGTFTTSATAAAVEVDDSSAGFSTSGGWTRGSSAGGNQGGYLFASARAQESASATWAPALALAGSYEVQVFYIHGTNRCAQTRYAVTTAAGAQTVVVDQTQPGAWRSLGTFTLDPTTAAVRLSNQSAGSGVVIADAVRFVPR